MTCRQWATTVVVASGIAVVTLSAQTPTPSFEVASLRLAERPVPPFGPSNAHPRLRGRLYQGTLTPQGLIRIAYDLAPFERIDGSQPVLKSYFQINAKVADDVAVPLDALKPMLRTLLAERFSLRVRFVDETQPVAVLRRVTPDTVGPNIRAGKCQAAGEVAVERADAEPQLLPCTVRIDDGYLTGRVKQMSDFARALSSFSGRPVVDDTGLTGSFEMEMAFNPATFTKIDPGPNAPSAQLPEFNKELREKLGLKLDTERRPVAVLVVERIEVPTDN